MSFTDLFHKINGTTKADPKESDSIDENEAALAADSDSDEAYPDDENDYDESDEDAPDTDIESGVEQTPAEVKQLQQQIKDLQARLDRAQDDEKARHKAETEQKTKQRIDELLTNIKNDDLPSGETIEAAMRELLELTGKKPEDLAPQGDPTLEWTTKQPDYQKVVTFAKENPDVHRKLIDSGVHSEQAVYFALKEVMQKRQARKNERALKNGGGSSAPGRVPKTGPGQKRGGPLASPFEGGMSPMAKKLLEGGGRLR